MQQAIVAYPQCRYMLMYVYEKGLLKQWYDAYAAGYEADPTGIKALEKVFDKKVAQIEADWKKWVAELPAPPLQLAANHAYVGVRVSAVVDGLRIVQIVPGSAADKAGLKVGDVISGIDDERVVDPDDLLLLVDAHKVGDELQIQYRRDGQYATVAVELLPMPATLPRLEEPQPKTRPATRPASAPVLAPAPRKKAA
jgi:predicted metalloprotease with PDZ domain